MRTCQHQAVKLGQELIFIAHSKIIFQKNTKCSKRKPKVNIYNLHYKIYLSSNILIGVCVCGGSITARQKLKEKRKDKMIERCSAEAGGRASYIGGKCQ